MHRKLIHIRPRNQLTLPQELLELWNVGPGDYLRVQITGDGRALLSPARIAVEGTPEAVEQNRRAEEDIKAGRYRTFEDAASFVESLQPEAPQRVGREKPAVSADIERALILATLQASDWNKRKATKRVLESLKKFHLEHDLERVK
jgi:bifunctional DNA-binding transcriptional regulator/antitoxin component of YhaV-PrlF toxin-antitoxin module